MCLLTHMSQEHVELNVYVQPSGGRLTPMMAVLSVPINVLLARQACWLQVEYGIAVAAIYDCSMGEQDRPLQWRIAQCLNVHQQYMPATPSLEKWGTSSPFWPGVGIVENVC